MLRKLQTLFGLMRAQRAPTPHRIDPKPRHLAVIMDGNGRWANSKGLSRVAGHKRGVEAVKTIIKSCIEHEIPVLSLFAFSSENWERPEAEVQALMDLLANALETQTKKLNEYGIKLQLLGDLDRFSSQIQTLADGALSQTADNTQLTLNVCINYGGRWDLTQAVRQIADKIKLGEIGVDQIDENFISEHLSTAGMPDPDLFIRTSGEYRISNFMLWQSAYSEFHFTDTLWPEFDETSLTDALIQFANRDRRFGNAADAVTDSSIDKQESSIAQMTLSKSSETKRA